MSVHNRRTCEYFHNQIYNVTLSCQVLNNLHRTNCKRTACDSHISLTLDSSSMNYFDVSSKSPIGWNFYCNIHRRMLYYLRNCRIIGNFLLHSSALLKQNRQVVNIFDAFMLKEYLFFLTNLFLIKIVDWK